MHIHNLDKWKCELKPQQQDRKAERQTRRVIALTLVMMIIEVSAGWHYGSMALLADGWHMGTHAAALGITAFAYWYARRHRDNPRFTFGTGKVGVLGGYTSAISLIIVALLMVVESIHRLISPVPIYFNQAIGVAVIGLAVNIVSALMLKGDHHHHHGESGHDHGHHHHGDHDHGNNHQDHNLRAAYMHVIADALTSVTAIVALLTGKYFGWVWMDPLMGIVGALVITRWGVGLLRDTSKILLDRDVPLDTVEAIRNTLEADADNRVVDLHLWHIGSGRLMALVSILTHFPREPRHYKELLTGFSELEHVTIEVNGFEGEPCLPHKAPKAAANPG